MLASLVCSPGYGPGWFHGANPYDEAVHLVNGMLAGALFAALWQPRPGWWRGAAGRLVGGLAFGIGLSLAWEAFEWAIGIIGNWTEYLDRCGAHHRRCGARCGLGGAGGQGAGAPVPRRRWRAAASARRPGPERPTPSS